MIRWVTKSGRLLTFFTIMLAAAGTVQAQRLTGHPVAGDIFREYSRANTTYAEWRVTDPNATNPFFLTHPEYLVNAVLPFEIGDLSNATRAEIVIDMWGGHPGTSGRKIRINGNTWLDLPNLRSTPGAGECYLSQYNPCIEVPVSHLLEGTNTIEGTNTGQTCWSFDWGQWGFNGFVLRVYYDTTKIHPTGVINNISYGGTLYENPTVTVSAASPYGVNKVEFLAWHEGYDTDGDGVYTDWQYNIHRAKTESVMGMKNNVGTATSAPWSVTWNTAEVPDQALGGITLGAIITDNNGVKYMVPYVEDVTLVRSNRSVKLYKSYNMPENCELRIDKYMYSNFSIPSGTNLGDATAASFWVSSYNGLDIGKADSEAHSVRLNNYTMPLFGDDHFYALDVLTIPTSALLVGENTMEYHSQSTGTGFQIHWPGPGIIVQFAGPAYGGPAPPAPALVSPANHFASQPLTSTLRWNKAWTATSYRLQVSTDSTFTVVTIDDSTITDTSKQVSGLEAFTKYYWRVRAKNAAVGGSFSPAWSFTTYVLLPTMLSPDENATGVALNPTLRWNKMTGATKYYVQLGIDPSFAGGLIVDDSTLTDTLRAVSGLSYNTQYYWRIAAKTAAGFTPFTSYRTFTTLVPVPGTVTLSGPANNATVASDSIVFTWRKQNGATKYWIELGFDSVFTYVQIDSSVADTVKGFKILVMNHKYFWKVKAGNAGGWGTFSAVRGVTAVTVGVDDVVTLPKEVRLYANYPNPFNPTTRIAFDLPRESHATLEVFNILGERVAMLVDEVKTAGQHTVTFDASGLASGIYLYRMTANDATLMQKMVLMK